MMKYEQRKIVGKLKHLKPNAVHSLGLPEASFLKVIL